MKSFTWKYGKRTNFGEITEVVAENETLAVVRYKTDISDCNPLLKIDKSKSLIYFLTEESSNGTFDFPLFESRGIKAEIYK